MEDENNEIVLYCDESFEDAVEEYEDDSDNFEVHRGEAIMKNFIEESVINYDDDYRTNYDVTIDENQNFDDSQIFEEEFDGNVEMRMSMLNTHINIRIDTVYINLFIYTDKWSI